MGDKRNLRKKNPKHLYTCICINNMYQIFRNSLYLLEC